MAEPIDAWMQQLRHALTSERRLRKTRIVDEAHDHLHLSAEQLEQRGMSRRDAEAKAVAQLGDPRRFAREFSPPARRDWLVDATAWWSSRAAATLLGLGALMVLIETLAWSIGAGPVSAQTVRVWRTCSRSINGECVGGWNDTHAPVSRRARRHLPRRRRRRARRALAPAATLLRPRAHATPTRRRHAGLTGDARCRAANRRRDKKLARRQLAVGTAVASCRACLYRRCTPPASSRHAQTAARRGIAPSPDTLTRTAHNPPA